MAEIIAADDVKGKASGRGRRACPLFLHATGQWAKKISGKMRYFGKDKAEALKRFASERDLILATGEVPDRKEKFTVRDLVNEFLTAKRQEVEEGNIGKRHFDALHTVCARVITQFGATARISELGPSDFLKLRTRLARGRSLPTLSREIRCVRSLFKFADEMDLLAKSVKFGPGMKLPTAKTMRKHREANAPQLPTSPEIRLMLEKAATPLKAFLLLGCNAAYGASDIAGLPRHVIEEAISTGWLEFARVKTGSARRCWLWQETRDALRVAIDKPRKAKSTEHGGLAFLTKFGQPYVRVEGDANIDGIGQEYNKLAKELGVKRRRGFYLLRHVFADKAGETGLTNAVDLVMGHAVSENDMSARYRHHVSDVHLKQVATHVHDWVFSPTKPSPR